MVVVDHEAGAQVPRAEDRQAAEGDARQHRVAAPARSQVDQPAGDRGDHDRQGQTLQRHALLGHGRCHGSGPQADPGQQRKHRQQDQPTGRQAAPGQRSSTPTRVRPLAEQPARQQHQRQGDLGQHPRHLFAGPAVDQQRGEEPERAEPEEQLPRAHQDDGQNAQDQRHELVQRQQHEVVEPGLPTAREVLLVEPVAERASGAGTAVQRQRDQRRAHALQVGQERGVQEQVDGQEQTDPHHPGGQAQGADAGAEQQPPLAAQQEPAAEQEHERDKAADVEVFFGREQQRRGRDGGEEPAPLAGGQVAEHGDHQQQRERVDVDVVADEPREVQEGRRDRQEQTRGDGAGTTQLVAKQVRHADDGHPEQGGHQSA